MDPNGIYFQFDKNKCVCTYYNFYFYLHKIYRNIKTYGLALSCVRRGHRIRFININISYYITNICFELMTYKK